MIKLDDIGPTVIINGGSVKYIELSKEEKQKRIDEINAKETNAIKEKEKISKKLEALEKLKADSNNYDLLLALGLIDE